MSLYRDQASILVHLMNASEPLGGNILARKMAVGSKTLKKEIDIINEYCKENGCHIASKVGSGYFLVITDQEAYSDFKEHVRRKYYGNQYYRNEMSERMHLIIRHFLSNRTRYNTDLADMCLCSESTVNRTMKRVKTRLKEYGLSIVNRTNKGMELVGSEWHIRLALLSEYEVYKTFEPVQFFDDEKQFNELFMHKGLFIDMLIERIITVLRLSDYRIPYYSLDLLADMILLTITRRKYEDQLENDMNCYEKTECQEEESIISRIFETLPILDSNELSYGEKYCLAVYLKSLKTVKYHDFLNYEDRNGISDFVEGFITYLNKIFDIKDYDLTVFRKDLSCEMYRLRKQLRYDIHVNKYRNANISREGMIILDLTVILFRYIRENTVLDINPSDMLPFYHIFTSLGQAWRNQSVFEILVVSKSGFYVSRNMAGSIASRSRNRNFKYTPVEFFDLGNMNMSNVKCILTDIEELNLEYPYKMVEDLYYIRRNRQVEDLERRIISNNFNYLDKVFTPDGINYGDGLETMEDIEKYSSGVIDGEKKNAFMESLYYKNKVFNPTKENRIMILNTVEDLLEEDIFKVIIFEESRMINGEAVGMVIFYNVEGKDPMKRMRVSQRIAKLLHTERLNFTYLPEEDYELIREIMLNQ